MRLQQEVFYEALEKLHSARAALDLNICQAGHRVTIVAANSPLIVASSAARDPK
jgi:hypothetical protein